MSLSVIDSKHQYGVLSWLVLCSSERVRAVYLVFVLCDSCQGSIDFSLTFFSTWNTYQDLQRTILNHKLKIWWSKCCWVGNFWWVEGPHDLDLSSWKHVKGCVARSLDPCIIVTIMCPSWTILRTKLKLIIIFDWYCIVVPHWCRYHKT